MAIKISLGKLSLEAGTLGEFVRALQSNGFVMLSIDAENALAVERLPQLAHRDPFDRVIVAQCLRFGLRVVSADQALDAYGVARVW